MTEIASQSFVWRIIAPGARVVATVGILALLFALAVGCRRDQPEETGSIFKDATMSGPADPKLGSQGGVVVQRADGPGGSASTTRSYKNCPNPKAVRSADAKTAEGTLYLVFQALLEPDPDTAFQQFYAHVNPMFQNVIDARRYWFESTRKDSSKGLSRLVYGPKDPSFDICETRAEGEGKVRIFVGKSPPVGSNPPYLLSKVGDKWLLETFSAF